MFDFEITAVFELLAGMTKEWRPEQKVALLQELTCESALRWRESNNKLPDDVSWNAPLPPVMKMNIYDDWNPQDSIECPQCGMVSYNENDIKNRYCGNCNQFHSDMKILQ